MQMLSHLGLDQRSQLICWHLSLSERKNKINFHSLFHHNFYPGTDSKSVTAKQKIFIGKKIFILNFTQCSLEEKTPSTKIKAWWGPAKFRGPAKLGGPAKFEDVARIAFVIHRN